MFFDELPEGSHTAEHTKLRRLVHTWGATWGDTGHADRTA